MTNLSNLWRQPEMWDVLARRDIGEVYRMLCGHGMLQTEIAALTGQAQSEVSAIMSGRQVMSYDLLERIAAGLEISSRASRSCLRHRGFGARCRCLG